jgi:phage terminase small subunit
MPVLKNARHEQFAQALAKGKAQAKAYAAAGYKPSEHHASRLASNGKVAARVREILAKVADKAEWSAADRLAALKRIHGATEKGDPRTAIAAIAEANKMQGSHAPVRQQHTGKDGGPIAYSNLTEEEIDARIAELARGAGAPDA